MSSSIIIYLIKKFKLYSMTGKSMKQYKCRKTSGHYPEYIIRNHRDSSFGATLPTIMSHSAL